MESLMQKHLIKKYGFGLFKGPLPVVCKEIPSLEKAIAENPFVKGSHAFPSY